MAKWSVATSSSTLPSTTTRWATRSSTSVRPTRTVTNSATSSMLFLGLLLCMCMMMVTNGFQTPTLGLRLTPWPTKRMTTLAQSRVSSQFQSRRAQQQTHLCSSTSRTTAADDDDGDQENGSSSTAAVAKQNIFGSVSDAITSGIFAFLHLNDDTGIQDASKNLRVLWARALLHSSNIIEDDVAEQLLPSMTRGIVCSELGATVFKKLGITKFLEWIQARTEFIDSSIDAFLSSPACTKVENDNEDKLDCQIVLFGAGYDTRALRYRNKHDGKIQFIEVDLPDVVQGKQKLYNKFIQESDDDEKEGVVSTLIPLDLNDCGISGTRKPKSIIDELKQRSNNNFRIDVPTMFVFEAVLFYVEEDAIRNIMDDISTFMTTERGGNKPESLLCMTDSLKPFVSVPFTNEADKFFTSYGLDLIEHRSRWGGAVHFALAANGVVTQATEKEEEENAPHQVVSTSTSASEQKAKADDVKVNAATPLNVVKSQQHNASSQAADRRQSSRSNSGRDRKHGPLATHVGTKMSSDGGGKLVYSYLPTRSNNPELLTNPSFENTWYAVAYDWQIDGYKSAADAENAKKRAGTKKPKTNMEPFATRLWGEPVVIYRDEDGSAVCVSDVCPHRSAPLSMGTVENGQLVCFYHGWKFGKEGKCTDVPTLRAIPSDKIDPNREEKFKQRVSKSQCSKHHACVEHEGLIWLWRGENVLTADTTKLPTRRMGDMETVTIDSVLDYNVDYSYIVENNLDSVHLFYLHDGSVPPLVSIGMMNKNLDKLRLSSFKDDCGIGHLGKLGDSGRPKKLIRFDPPNIVRHGGVSGFEEEFHIIPIAPHRTRVLLRQHIPKGPILSTVTSLPGMMTFLTALVNNWNYHIGLEDASVMVGQSHLIEEFGAPRMNMGGLCDDLIAKYWKWRDEAHANLNKDSEEDGVVKSPYFSSYLGKDGTPVPSIISTGSSVYGDSPKATEVTRRAAETARTSTTLASVDDSDRFSPETGAGKNWGIKRGYTQNTPLAEYPPMNYKRYKEALRWDDLTKKLLLNQEPSCTMLKTMKEEEKSRGLSSSREKLDSQTTATPARAAFGGASVLAAVVLMQGGFALPSLADAMSFDASNFLFFLK